MAQQSDMAVHDQQALVQSAARSDILALFHRYAVLATETPSINDMAALFHHDAIFRLPNGIEVQPAKLLEVVRGNNPKFIRHHITSSDIEFVSESEARSRSFYFALTHLSTFDHWGRWEDVVTKDANDRWLIKDRSVIVENGDPRGWYKQTYP